MAKKVTVTLVDDFDGGVGAVAFDAGDIILGGDGSDRISGNAGDDIIDGDKYLEVSIGVYENTPAGLGTGPLIATYHSMTELSALMFNGTYNPGQLKIIREIRSDTTPGDVDVAVFQGSRGEYTFSATADGQLIVTHAVEDSLDGTDRLRGIEQVEFLGGAALNIRVGTAGNDVITGTAQEDLILGLGGNDILNGGNGNDILVGGTNGPAASGQYADDFNSPTFGNSTGSTNWRPDWVEADDSGGVTTGQIRIDGVIPPGDITYYDVVRIFPLGGKLSVIRMPGSVLRTLLDSGSAAVGQGGFLVLHQIHKLDGVWQVRGDPLAPERLYTIVGAELPAAALAFPPFKGSGTAKLHDTRDMRDILADRLRDDSARFIATIAP